MHEIGGYFEWEMAPGCDDFHPNATLLLKSARSCLALLLEREKPRRIRVPFYLCDEALEPLEGSATEMKFYSIDEKFEILGGPPDLEEDERLLYVNYFGLKSGYIRQLEDRYRENLWIDDVQAFFHVPEKSPAAHFNSARKFVGVPDGAHLYLPDKLAAGVESLSLPVNTKYVLDHLTMRLEGKTQEGRQGFRENDLLAGGEIAEVSAIGRAMLSRIDFESVLRRRRENYLYLHEALASSNKIASPLLNLAEDAVPYCYPYLPSTQIPKEALWQRKVFVPWLWQECTKRGDKFEREMAAEILPLPIDQRYDLTDMDRLVATLRESSDSFVLNLKAKAPDNAAS